MGGNRAYRIFEDRPSGERRKIKENEDSAARSQNSEKTGRSHRTRCARAKVASRTKKKKERGRDGRRLKNEEKRNKKGRKRGKKERNNLRERTRLFAK
ncbi:hypothetical protein PUN28_017105 [Cardiocondyla obscurior]|uniref:Uncharacterized protein n=1 Tax=Cardiocondyla obscurior TaxID=286306 RepID=A0AAW2EQS6_9HYME